MVSFRKYSIVAGACAMIGFLALLSAQGTASPASALFADSDGDSVIDNAETVTGSDPNDPDSTPEELFPDIVLGTALCADGIDNDADGLADDADAGCTDSDADVISDQMEGIVGSDPQDGQSFPEDARFDAVLDSLGFGFFESCANGEDDDGDGAADAADSGCEAFLTDADSYDDRVEKRFGSDPSNSNSVPEHNTPNPGSCSDGIDNDRDGATDAAESACRPAANDDIDDAHTISTIPFEHAVKITSATVESGEPNSRCFFDPPASVWYRYTPTVDGALAVDTSGSNFQNDVAVWTRSGSQLNEVACGNGFAAQSFAAMGARASFAAEAGETYYIQVAAFLFPDEPADLRLSLEPGIPPANDNFASAETVTSLPFNDSLNVSDATSEFGEPSSDCHDDPYSSVWYEYTPTSDGLLVADARRSGYPVGIAVWTDSVFGLADVACSGGRVAFEVEAGRSYSIQVISLVQGVASQLQFELAAGVSPANDDFAAATNVTTTPFQDTVDTFTATREIGEPEPSCAFGERVNTVWYRVTPQQSGYLQASAEADGSSFGPTVVAAYQGTSLNGLTELACGNPFFSDTVRAAFAVTAGQTYYIQAGVLQFGGFVEGGSAPGIAGFPIPSEITVHIETLSVPACAASEFTQTDPRDDAIGFGGPTDEAVDVVSVSGGDDGSNYCFRIEFAEPLPPAPDFPFDPGTLIRLGIDTDSNQFTGFGGGLDFPCDGALGRELSARIEAPRDLLIDVNQFFIPPPFPGGGGPPEGVPGFAVYGERSMQIILPMGVLGDDNFRFALSVSGLGGVDCAPNGGAIVSPRPPAPGDANCDGAVNSLDSQLILQRFAGLIFGLLPCEYAGDVNQNGSAGPLDAVLILQYAAGMISELPPVD